MTKRNFKQGFTLIELLIVITIIGILAVALVPTILSAPQKGRDAARQTNLSAIATALEAYNLSSAGYPLIAGCVSNKDPEAADGVINNNRLANFQGRQIPVDPLKVPRVNSCAGGAYYYVPITSNPGANYVLYAKVEKNENGNFDGTVPTAPIATLPTIGTCAAASTTCYYAVVK